ncbi:ABC transporter B family member 21-like [Rhodamnia argentea]|uniref:ABC transporter B family member 21-like n=1 Tax=Rhodamnia argentea TaxID=178133 RepID=A0ABM3GY18_9MYRT|nr:ABC transporter B family member 21-like [Rhodamnia argentea]
MGREMSSRQTSSSRNHLAEVEQVMKDGAKMLPYHKLFSFADSFDYFLMFLGTIAAIENGIATPLMTVLFGDLIDSVGKNFDTSIAVHEVNEVCLKIIYLALGSGFASFLQVACWMITAERQATRIRNSYLRTVLRQEIAFFDKETSTGEIIVKISSNTFLIQEAVGEKVGNFIQFVATFLGGFFIAFVKGWLFTLAMLSTIPPLVICGAITVKLTGKLMSHAQGAYSVAATIVDQTIGSIRTVASFSGEKQAVKKYNKSLIKAYRFGVQEGLVVGLGFGMLMFTVFCSYSFAVWLGGKMIAEKGYTGGRVINVVFAVLLGSLSLGQASPCLSAFVAGQAAAFEMFDAMKRKPEIDAFDKSGKRLEALSGHIELRDVYFSYPTRPNERVLNALSLVIPGGSTAALVGHSGSGKSTIVSLIERFYDPQEGEILIDHVNIRELQLRWIRGKIGLVSQEPVLFFASIRDNIAYGKDGATNDEIIAAAKVANAANFIDMLPQGLATMVGEHGIHLSGGQKQRIAIARAVLKDPKILLLDEATSALDVESERVVQEALDRVMKDRTTVVIAHRLSTVRDADVICVIDQGKIIEKGSHDELVKNFKGAYSQLFRLQEAAKEPERTPVKYSDQSHLLFSASSGQSPEFSFSYSDTASEKGLGTSDSKASSPAPEVSLTRLAYLNSPEIPVLLLGAIAAACNGIIYPIFGSMLASLIKTFCEPVEDLRKDSKYWALMFLILGMASLVVTPLSMYFFAVAGCKLIKRIRSMSFEKVVHMDIGWFDETEHSSGAIGARLSTDATSVRLLVGDTLALLAQNAATMIAGLLIAFKTNWELALVILALLPLIGISGYVQMQSMKGFNTDAEKLYGEASQVASDAVANMRTVASFCAEEKMVALYQTKSRGRLKGGVRKGIISGIGFGLSFFLLFFVYAVSFHVGAELVGQNKTTFPKVFRVFFVLTMTGIGISQSNSLAPNVSKAKSSVASIFEILDLTSKIDASGNRGTTLANVKGDIKFHHLKFKYPTRPELLVFKDFCLSIHSGQSVALVGESGSGKSTVVSLLQRFYDPDSGRITLDGADIRELNLEWLRGQMGLVSQEPVLFNDTIRANIAYGKGGSATEAEIVVAAELANAHNFISGLQQGYDTTVGERGIQLSGGQKQRVAIARAIVKNPRILLLDEATSALDIESERVVQDALDRAMARRTTLVVAHRLSTIRRADVIAVLKDGAIVEKGSHETLMNMRNGIYATMTAPHDRVASVK